MRRYPLSVIMYVRAGNLGLAYKLTAKKRLKSQPYEKPTFETKIIKIRYLSDHLLIAKRCS